MYIHIICDSDTSLSSIIYRSAMISSDAAAASGPVFSPCLTLFMDPSQLCTEVTWLKQTKTVSVRADLDMVAYLPNGLLFSIVCWQQQLQISDSLANPFFNPVLHNVHLATTRWQDLFQSNGPPPAPETWQKHWLKSCTKGCGKSPMISH